MTRSTKIRICHRGASMLFYPAALPLSRQTLTYTAGVIRRHRKHIGSPWRKLNPAQQALLVLACLRKLRCCPWKAGQLAKAIHVLQAYEGGG
jgi:hypothetical protein